MGDFVRGKKTYSEKKPTANRLLENKPFAAVSRLSRASPLAGELKKRNGEKYTQDPTGLPPSGGLLMFRGVRTPARPLNPNQQPNRKRKKIGSGNLLRSLVVIAGLIGTPAKPGSKFPSSGQKRIKNGQRRGNSAARERKGDMYTTFFKGKRVLRAAD